MSKSIRRVSTENVIYSSIFFNLPENSQIENPLSKSMMPQEGENAYEGRPIISREKVCCGEWDSEEEVFFFDILNALAS